jgi:glycosyltransferase involved in cell wall biosynthesis
MPEPVDLTILMPCLNEAETLARCIEKAKKGIAQSGVRGEILIADNGSTDGSQGIAEKNGARVAAISEKGYGSALIGGTRAAAGKWILMGDADDSYDFSEADRFVKKFQEGFDLVMGCRPAAGRFSPARCRGRTGGSVILFCPSLGDFFLNVPSTTFTAACGVLPGTRLKRWICKRRAWNLPRKWSSRRHSRKLK